MLEIPQGAGSGFVWDRSGHVVTNYHVIKGANDIMVGGLLGRAAVPTGGRRRRAAAAWMRACCPRSLPPQPTAAVAPPAAQVTLGGGSDYPGTIVGFDEDKDVAVLQIDTGGERGSRLRAPQRRVLRRPPRACTPGGRAPVAEVGPLLRAACAEGKESLQPLRLGQSADLEVGQRVYAIG